MKFFQDHALLGYSWWTKVKCWSVTPLRSSEVTRGHQQFFADNLRLRRAKDMQVVSMCLSRQYASTNMQFGSRRDLDLRSNFELDLSRSTCICFRGILTKGTRCRSNFISIMLFSKVISEKPYGKKRHFYLTWPLEANVLNLHHIWCTRVTSTYHGLSFAFLYSA